MSLSGPPAPDRPQDNLEPAETGPVSAPDLTRSAVTAVAWNGLQLWVYNIVALGVFVILGRILSPRDFGLAASAMVVILFLRVIVDAGFSRLLVQRTTIDRALIDTAFWTACLIGVSFTGLTVAAAPLLARLFGQPELTELIRALSLIFVFVALDSTPAALLQRELQWRTLALRRLAATGASAGVAVWLAIAGAGAWALVGQQLVLEGLTVAFLWFVTPWRPSLRFSGVAFRELLAFGTRYSGLRVLWYLGANIDNFLIGVFLGPISLGYYVIAYRIFTVLNELIVTTINNVALPMFSRMREDQATLNAAFRGAVAAASVLALPVYTGLAIVASQLVPTVFGSRWAPSAPVLEFLAIAGFLQAQLAFTSSYVIATGLIHRELLWTLAVTAAELSGFVLTVHHGITAVAGALAAVLALAWPVRLVFVQHWGGPRLTTYLRPLLPLAASTSAMAAIVLALKELVKLGGGAGLTIEILAGALAYPLALRLFAPAQVRFLRALLRRRRSAA